MILKKQKTQITHIMNEKRAISTDCSNVKKRILFTHLYQPNAIYLPTSIKWTNPLKKTTYNT